MGDIRSSEQRLIKLFAQIEAELDGTKEETPNAVQRQSQRLRKKAEFNKPDLASKAINDFVILNEIVAKTSIDLSPAIVANAKHFITCALERYTSARLEYCIQVTLSEVLLMDGWGFGKGAVVGSRSKHPAEKMSDCFSCTPEAAHLVQRLRRGHPYLAAFDAAEGVNIALVPGSKLQTVPKNEEKERTIAIEPLGNMCLQLAAGRYLEGALRSVGFDITKQQPKNREAARAGSIDGRLSTIDLSNASDMFSPELIRLLFPKEWYELLMRLRSPQTVLPDGRVVQLNMISTMGNGFTFPMMTLSLVALLYAMTCETGRWRNLYLPANRFFVFGDDIICPTEDFDRVCTLLRQAGLVVNHDKSFSQGTFRESCGGDFDSGEDITPFYVKRLSNDADIYVAINKILEWGSRHKMLWKSLELLVGFLDKRPFLVPEWSQDTCGIRVSSVGRRYKGLTPIAKRVPYKGSFGMSLAVGGFLECHKGRLFYLPRQDKPRYKVSSFRLPKGFLNGRDPLLRSRHSSELIDLAVRLVT